MFFWVSPRRQIVVCRRFVTLCQFHLQRLDVEYEVWIVRGRMLYHSSSRYPHFILYIQPLKMEMTEGSETSSNYNLTPGKYPKEHIQYSNHGGSLKSRIIFTWTCSHLPAFRLYSEPNKFIQHSPLTHQFYSFTYSYVFSEIPFRLSQQNTYTRVGTLIVSTIYLQLIQNRYMFRSFTVLQCSHQHCVQPVASDVEVVGYL